MPWFLYGLRRLRFYGPLLGALLLGVSVACGLFASAPLYRRAVAELSLRHALQTSPHHMVNLQILSSIPLDESAWATVARVLGPLIARRVDVAYTEPLFHFPCPGRGGTRGMCVNSGRERRSSSGFSRVSRPSSLPRTRSLGLDTPSATRPAVASVLKLTRMGAARGVGRLHLYAFTDLASHVRLLAGRWPRSVPSFFQAVGGWPQETVGPTVHAFHPSAVDLEALVSADVAREMGVGVGSRLRVGPSSQRTVSLRIAGVFEALDPREPYWMAQLRPLKGEWVEARLEPRYYGALVVNPEDFQARIAPLEPPTTYAWYVLLDRERIHAGNMAVVRGQVVRMAEGLRAVNPDVSVVSGLVSLIARLEAALGRVQAPVTLVLLAPLTLTLYYLMTTASLVLEGQAREWATLSSRGASATQLILLHLAMMVPLCLVGALVGPGLAQIGLALVHRVGPLAALAVNLPFPLDAPASLWTYSAVAAVLAELALLLPALPASGRGMVALRQAQARPPQQPAWTRFHLDLTLLAVGAGLAWRAASYGGLRTVTLAGERGLDSLHLAAPFLLLTGSALLWLRLFPLGARLAATLAARRRGLTLPLALWGVGRDPGYYAHLVLLLLGAVALGTFSLVIEATREWGGWEVARQQIGGDVRVTLTRRADPWATDWEGLPGVEAATLVFRGASDRPYAPNRVVVLGVDPKTLPAVTGVPREELELLTGPEHTGAAIPALVGHAWARGRGLKVGDSFSLSVSAPGQGPSHRIPFVVAGVVEEFPTLAETRGNFIVAPLQRGASRGERKMANEVWLDVVGEVPEPDLLAALSRPELQVKEVATAVELRDAYRREPLPNALAGALFAGFWAAMGLSLAGFGLYLALTARRRAVSFAVLRVLGWSGGDLARLLALEGLILALPALVVGLGLGVGLARLLQPFLPLPDRAELVLPWLILRRGSAQGLGGLILTLAVGFGLLLIGLVAWLRARAVAEPLRLAEE